jgi:hypothetical protein
MNLLTNKANTLNEQLKCLQVSLIDSLLEKHANRGFSLSINLQLNAIENNQSAITQRIQEKVILRELEQTYDVLLDSYVAYLRLQRQNPGLIEKSRSYKDCKESEIKFWLIQLRALKEALTREINLKNSVGKVGDKSSHASFSEAGKGTNVL